MNNNNRKQIYMYDPRRKARPRPPAGSRPGRAPGGGPGPGCTAPALSPSLPLSLSRSLALSLSLYLSIYLSSCLSLSVCLSIYPSLSLSLAFLRASLRILPLSLRTACSGVYQHFPTPSSHSKISRTKIFAKGWVAQKLFFFIGSGVIFSKGWVRKDENLRTQIGCTDNNESNTLS